MNTLPIYLGASHSFYISPWLLVFQVTSVSALLVYVVVFPNSLELT